MKKLVVQKKKLGDVFFILDVGLFLGFQVDFKFMFKRFFLYKIKDKKYSLEGVEELENVVFGYVVLEIVIMKKGLEVFFGYQYCYVVGEKCIKELGGKGKKN